MGTSRLGKALERAALHDGGRQHLGFANVQSRPPVPQQIAVTAEMLKSIVPSLLQQGVQIGWSVQFDAEAKLVRFNATCGPISIPVDFDAEAGRKLAAGLQKAVDQIDPLVLADERDPDAEIIAAAARVRQAWIEDYLGDLTGNVASQPTVDEHIWEDDGGKPA